MIATLTHNQIDSTAAIDNSIHIIAGRVIVMFMVLLLNCSARLRSQ